MIVEKIQDAFAALTFSGTNPRDPVVKKMLGLGQQATAGVSVDHERTMAIPAVKRAVQIITDKMFRMPWHVFKEVEDGQETDRGHPSWMCIASQANAELDAPTVRKQLTQWAMLYGNGCAAIYWPEGWPNRGNVELVPMLPDRTWLERVSPENALQAGTPDLANALVYRTEIGGEVLRLSQSNVLHIKGMGPNPYWGWDIVELMHESLGGVVAKEEFGNRFFGQGANPAGFIEMPGSLDEESEETYMASLSKAMQGLGKAHKIIMLEEGAKFTPATIDPEKSQLLEGKQFDIRTVSMVIGIKPHKLIDGANSAFASLQEANQEHKDDDVMPWVDRWRVECNAKLLTDEQRRSGSHSIEVDDEYLEWVPQEQRVRSAVEMLNNGVATKDEVRRKMNLRPSRTARAKDYRIPANIVYEDDQAMVGTGNTAAMPSTSDEDSEQASQEPSEADLLIAAHVAGYRKRLHKIGVTKAKKGSKEFLTWLDGLKPEQAATQRSQEAVDAACEQYTDAANRIADEAISDEQLVAMVEAMETSK